MVYSIFISGSSIPSYEVINKKHLKSRAGKSSTECPCLIFRYADTCSLSRDNQSLTSLKSHNLGNILLIYCKTVRWVKYWTLYFCQVGSIPSASPPLRCLKKKSDWFNIALSEPNPALLVTSISFYSPGAPYSFIHFLLQISGVSEVNSFLLPLEVSTTYSALLPSLHWKCVIY